MIARMLGAIGPWQLVFYGQDPIVSTGFDPLRTFKIGPMKGREAPENGLRMKACA